MLELKRTIPKARKKAYDPWSDQLWMPTSFRLIKLYDCNGFLRDDVRLTPSATASPKPKRGKRKL